jgi:hypothetical protein
MKAFPLLRRCRLAAVNTPLRRTSTVEKPCLAGRVRAAQNALLGIFGDRRGVFYSELSATDWRVKAIAIFAYDGASARAEGQDGARLTEAAQKGYVLSNVLTRAGINGIGLDYDTFQSIRDKHGPGKTRTYGSTFDQKYVTNIGDFSDKVLIPATEQGAVIVSVTPYARVPGQYDIIVRLPYIVGTDIHGTPTDQVLIRVAPSLIMGWAGYYNVTGAFPY